MTQALNLANFANTLNTSGATSNAGLQNSTISGVALGSNLNSLTIGTGLSGSSYNGSSAVTIANTGVTSVTAGTGISVSASTGGVTITNTSSSTAGNGISVTGSTIAVAAPSFNSVGSYANVGSDASGTGYNTFTSGSNYSAGTGVGQIYAWTGGSNTTASVNSLSGTWKWMGATITWGFSTSIYAIAVRVA